MSRNIYVKIWGGLGDIALSTPIFKELKIRYPASRIIALCRNEKDTQVLKGNPYLDALRILNPYYRGLYKILEAVGIVKILYTDYARLRPSFSYKIKAPDIIAEMIGISLSDNTIQLYLSEEEEANAKATLAAFRNPVILNITSVTSTNQMWPVEEWNKLVAAMPDCTFIQLGLPREERVEGSVDMRGKTSIRESMALVKYAAGFAGVVSFLSHVTNAFNTRGVVLFGPSSIAVWGHANNINVSRHLPCSNCLAWLRVKCPYGKPCMRRITVQQVKEAIHQQLFPSAVGNKNNLTVKM